MDKKSFVSYVAENKTEYKYVLKFALHDMPNETIDMLEACLTKYDLKTASSFRKTPIQANPLDFPNVNNTAVYICDITLGYPASLDLVKTYICNSLAISPTLLVVYSENDPRQIETDLYVDRSSPEYKAKYKAKLGADYESDSGQQQYGEKYNIGFLQELEKVRKEREITLVTNALSPVESSDHSTLPADYDSFNDAKNLKKDDVGLFGRVKKSPSIKAGAK